MKQEDKLWTFNFVEDENFKSEELIRFTFDGRVLVNWAAVERRAKEDYMCRTFIAIRDGKTESLMEN